MEIAPQVPHNRVGCCGSVHAKIFEILLIVGFIIALIGLALNLVLTMCYFFYSDYIFFLEIGLIVFDLCCFFFSILLRVWRSNGSVLDQKYSASFCISLFILIFSIINLLGSIGEDVLFYFTIGYQFGSLSVHANPSRMKIFEKIMNKFSVDNDDDEPKFIFIKNEDLNLKILKYLPWVSMNFNALVQIICLIFVLIIRQRIRFKSDFGTQNTMALQGSSENRMNTNRNAGTNLGIGSNNINNGNIYEGKVENMPKKKKSKKKKDKENGEPNQVPDSEQIDIMNKKKKKKKKAKRKKNKSKKKERKKN